MVDNTIHYRRKTTKQLEDNEQIVFRYSSATGEVNEANNPNGSLNNIAGIVNEQGNVLGMMPHPERASDPAIGITDGRVMFEGLLSTVNV